MTDTTNTPAAKLSFEKVTCGRCGGDGRYSYCQTMRGKYGPHTCFKCNGSGFILTKRGAVASAFIVRVFSKPAKELVPGDKVRKDGVWSTVNEAHQETEDNNTGWSESNGVRHYWFRVNTDHCGYGTTADQMFRVAQSAERKAEVFPLVSEYQDLLTKAGKEPKSKAKAARVAEIRAALNVPEEWAPFAK